VNETKQILVDYTVVRKFCYNRVWLKPGDKWIPQGSRYDFNLAKSNLVRRVERVVSFDTDQIEPKPEPKVKTKRGLTRKGELSHQAEEPLLEP
jgi:hypothetical protein